MIKYKIPKEIIEQVDLSKGADVWTVKILRERLRIHLNEKEEADRLTLNYSESKCVVPSKVPNHQQNNQFRNPYRNPRWNMVTVALVSNSRARNPTMFDKPFGPPLKHCFYCQEEHLSEECSNFPNVEARRQRIRGNCSIV